MLNSYLSFFTYAGIGLLPSYLMTAVALKSSIIMNES
jgi:hypothetical protein